MLKSEQKVSLLKKISYLLSKRDKRNLVIIFIIILISAFLDLIGVSIIMPVVSILTQGREAIDNNFILSTINNIFKFQYDTIKIGITTLIFMVSLFLFKALYAVFTTYVVTRFTENYSRKLTKKLMETYLMFPYEFHLDNNSSTLIRKSTYDVQLFTYAINEILNFIVKITSAFVIVVYLFITNWLIALIVGGMLGLFSLIILLVIKPKTKKIGEKLQIHNSDNYKYLSQAFNGIKETKISNTESFFTNEYDYNRGIINKFNLKRAVLNSIPGHSIEFIGILGICVSLIVVMASSNDDLSLYLVNTFSVFAYAVIKLLPSLSTITGTINNINFYQSSIESLYEDILLAENKDFVEINGSYKPIEFKSSITAKNVSFYYSSMPDKKVLSNISFSIKRNTSVAFSGASGAGKTTLIDLILGLLPCREGAIYCDDIDIKTNVRGWRTNISYIPQNIYLSDDTIRNNIAFGIDKKCIDDSKIWDSLEKAQLKDYVNSLPKGLDTVIGERGVRMSGGQRQRIGIARAFYRNTNIIVFDEATSALDYETEKNILEHVSQYSTDHTLIIITHRLNTIESCDSIYKVEDLCVKKIK